MKHLYIILSLFICLLSNSLFAQLDPYEANTAVAIPPAVIPNNDFNKVEYDRCNGVLNVAMESTRSGTNGTWVIKKAFVYIKIGTQWKKMVTIRSVKDVCVNGANTACTGTAASDPWSSGEDVTSSADWSPAAYTNVSQATYGGNVSYPQENPAIDKRIAYANGAHNNHSWASYEDHNICNEFDANLTLTNASVAMDLVPWETPPRLHSSHSSKIAQNMGKIGFYPSNGSEWGIQFGVTNIPQEAMSTGTINVRIYKHTRSMCCPNQAGPNPTQEAWEVLELATSVGVMDAPFGLSASDDECGKIILNWQNATQSWSSSSNCTNTMTYKNVIYRDGVKVGVVNGDVTTYTDSDATLKPRQKYDYTVKTILWNKNNKTFRSSSVSNLVQGNMKLPPEQPSPFNATTDNCNTQVALSWSQPSGTATDHYKILSEYGVTPTSSLNTTITGGKRAYNDNSVTRGTDYQYYIAAFNDCGYSSDTAQVNGISPADPAIPTNVSVTLAATSDTATITWTDAADNETKYEVHRQDDEGNLVIYNVNKKDGSGTTLTYIDNGITSCKAYSYTVVAFNECVQSGLQSSSDTTGVVPPPNLSTTFTSTKKLVCSKGYYNNRVELNFSYNNSQNIDIFNIYRKVLGTADDSTLIGTAGQGEGLYIDNTADAGIFYKYTIKGIKYCSGSDLSSNLSEDIGFRSPTGVVNGHIQYTGGVAVKNVKVTVEPVSAAVGNAITLNGTNSVDIPNNLSNIGTGDTVAVEAWFKSTASTAADIQKVASKAGTYDLQLNYTTNKAEFKIVLSTGTETVSYPFTNGVTQAQTATIAQDSSRATLSAASAFVAGDYMRFGTTDSDPVFLVDSVKGSGQYVYIKGVFSDPNYSGSVQKLTKGQALAGNISLNSYYHICGSYDGSYVKLFVNGVAVDSVAASGTVTHTTNPLKFGSGFKGQLDEMRVWNRTRSNLDVNRDYAIMKTGDEGGIVALLHADEGSTQYVFDISKTGLTFNANDATFNPTNSASWSSSIPTKSQLSYAGFTDINGDYTVAGVRYTGIGANYKVTPYLNLGGVHQFTPGNKVLFLGDGANVQNAVDFLDESSFRVTGNVRYFNSTCPAEGINVLIDGEIVIEAGTPVETDNSGFFDIQVPIGKHIVTVAKNDHYMSSGRFPSSGTYDFQADAYGIQFIDSTLVKVTGRAVGGLREASHLRGLGRSKNNIGQAEIIFTSLLGGGCYKDTVTTNVNTGEYTHYLPPLKYNVEVDIPSNPTIDFGVQSLLNLDNIPQLVIKYDTISYDSITAIYTIDSTSYNKALDFIHRVDPKIIVTDFADHSKDFIGMEEIVYTEPNGTEHTRNLRTNPFPWPVFSSKDTAGYRCHIQVYEEYTNMQNGAIDSVPTTDGTLKVSNGMIKMGVTGVEMKNVNTTLDSLSEFFYKFKVNNPNFLENTSIPEYSFTSVLDIYLQRPDGSIISWLPDNFNGIGSGAFNAAYDDKYRAYVLGIKADGLQFLTAGPDIPEYILRDPPGSNSSATREVGTTKTSEHTWSSQLGGSAGTEDAFYLGAKFSVGLGVSTATEIENNNTVGFKAEFSGGTSGSGTSTITNTQAWSTNANNELPGNGSDLYIGKSKNVSFGITETLKIVPDSLCTKIECLGSPFDGYSFAKAYGLSIVPGGYGTQFIYSENHIVNYLIPTLENLRNVMLQSNSKYSVHLANDNENYGLNNDDPRVNTSLPQLTSDETIEYMLQLQDSSYMDTIYHSNGSYHTEKVLTSSKAQKAVWDQLKAMEKPAFSVMTGASYTYAAADREDSLTGDSVRWINNQIRQWEQSVMLNEWEKVNIGNATIKARLKERELSDLYKRYKTELALYYLSAAASGAITGIGAIASIVAPAPGSAIAAGVGFGIGSAAGMIAAELELEVAKYENAKDLIIAKYDQTSANYSISGGNVFSSALTHESATSFSRSLEYGMSTSLDVAVQGKVNNNGVGFKKSIGMDFKSSRDWGESSSSTETVSFTLDDPDQGDFFSVDAYPSLLGWGPIFKLRPGGATQCPHEDQILTTYYKDKPANSGTNPDYPYVELSARTFQMDKPTIDVSPSILTNVPTGEKASFNLTIGNESEVNDDMTYRLTVVSASNPFGAIIKIDGVAPNANVTIGGNSSINKVLTVEKGGGPVYNYDSLLVIVHSLCQYEAGTADQEDIVDSVYISAHFLPTCTEAKFIEPEDQWILNNSFNDTMMVSIYDYDINFHGLENIRLDYKPSAQSTWSSLETFHKDTAGMGPEAKPIPTSTAFTLWDWPTKSFVDGPYDLRLVSHCTLADEVSVIHSGVMDRINPHPFGTPSPADGILSPNDDIEIQFNEPVDLGQINTFNFDIRGVLNGTDIRHDASLHFDGVDDYLKIANGIDLKGSSTIEMYVKRNRLNTNEVVFSQGVNSNQKFEIGFNTADQVTVNIGNASYNTTSATGIIDDNDWHHLAVSYDDNNNIVEVFIDGALEGNGSLAADYTEGGDIYIGKSTSSASTFEGYIHELRIWDAPTTASDLVVRMNITLSGREFDLVGVWPIDEAIGEIAQDKARNRHATVHGANWRIFPSGHVVDFDGSNDTYISYNTSQMSFSDEMDFTIEFWYNASTQTDSACLFSNGKGDDNLSWAIYTDPTGQLFIKTNGINNTVVSSNTFDGNWHHFAMVVKRTSNTAIYLDGNLASTISSANVDEFGAPNSVFGSRTFYTGSVVNHDQFFTGMLDEVRIWNLSRKQEQIKRDMVNRLNGDEFGLQLYLPFETYKLELGVPILTDSLINIVNDSLPLASGNTDLTGTDVPNIKLPRPISSLPFTYSINNDRIIITPNMDPALIENVTLDITVKDIPDLNGNVMQSPKTWIAYIDKNQVVWEDSEHNIDILLDETYSFDTKILNIGGQLMEYEISNLPTWLTANHTDDAISPNSYNTVTFSVPQGVNIGTYEQDIYLTTDFGFDEKLHVTLKVTEESPNWEIDPTDFQHSMSIIGSIKVDGIISTDDEDKLVATVNGDVRGVANLQYYEQYDAYLVFLDVYSNTVGGDSLEFWVWDASAGKTHIEVTPDLIFQDNQLVGTPNTPQVFEAIDIIDQPIPLKNGWNWISFNLNSPIKHDVNLLMQNVNAGDGDILKGIVNYDQYSEGFGWLGTITGSGGTDIRELYKIRLSNEDTINYYGSKINPEDYKIPIDSGWNWIGFIATKNVSVANAFGNFTVNHGDLLKGQQSFAIYDSTLGWVGSLSFMVPTRGYMFKSAKEDTLVYPNSSVFDFRLNQNSPQEILNTSVNLKPEEYQYNMNIIAAIDFCDGKQIEGLKLVAYTDNGIRGIAPIENSKAFLTVYANTADEKIDFKLLDDKNEEYSSTDFISFNANTLLGSLENPFLIKGESTLEQCDDLDVEEVSVSTFNEELINNANGEFIELKSTNFNDEINLNYQFNSPTSLIVDLYGIDGKKIANICSYGKINGFGSVVWRSTETNLRLAPGMYLIHINHGNNAKVEKIIKSIK